MLIYIIIGGGDWWDLINLLLCPILSLRREWATPGRDQVFELLSFIRSEALGEERQ